MPEVPPTTSVRLEASELGRALNEGRDIPVNIGEEEALPATVITVAILKDIRLVLDRYFKISSSLAQTLAIMQASECTVRDCSECSETTIVDTLNWFF